MRKFSSYGPINRDLHYYVPRSELLAKARTYLVGDNPAEGGHYFTVWGFCYGLELKSFADLNELKKSIHQASEYGRNLTLGEITLIVFIDTPMPDELKREYAGPFEFPDSATVHLFLVVTG